MLEQQANRNFRISENPQVIEERPLHPCTLWSEGAIGSYFFENDDGTTVAVNSEHFGHMITEKMWFQQDSATCHTTRPIMRFDTIRLFCEAMRKTLFMQKNLRLLST